jgi:hypothetical protein
MHVPEAGVWRTACDAMYDHVISGKGCQRATALHIPVLWSQIFIYDFERLLASSGVDSPAVLGRLYMGGGSAYFTHGMRMALAQPTRMR